tara:strand:+ start:768 stop:1019 length:252 start_codon:yes stop_codon:yes gene_type:complete
MKRRRNFKKKKFKDEARGLSVTVFNNNVEGALKVLKKKVKNSNIMQELREKQYYRKPSEVKREKKNLQKLRYKYKNQKVQKNY